MMFTILQFNKSNSLKYCIQSQPRMFLESTFKHFIKQHFNILILSAPMILPVNIVKLRDIPVDACKYVNISDIFILPDTECR